MRLTLATRRDRARARRATPRGGCADTLLECAAAAVLRAPARAPDPELAPHLKYYSSAVHAAAFVLPEFAERVVSQVRQPPLPYVCR
eukprot:454111-Prymnesium_polylepis.2